MFVAYFRRALATDVHALTRSRSHSLSLDDPDCFHFFFIMLFKGSTLPISSSVCFPSVSLILPFVPQPRAFVATTPDFQFSYACLFLRRDLNGQDQHHHPSMFHLFTKAIANHPELMLDWSVKELSAAAATASESRKAVGPIFWQAPRPKQCVQIWVFL